jgi:hypothetical protein
MRQPDFSIELKMAWNTVDSAISSCLRKFGVQHQRTQHASEDVAYELTHSTLGELGQFNVRGVSDGKVLFVVEGPDAHKEKAAAVRAGKTSHEESKLREAKRRKREAIFEGLLSNMRQDGLLAWPKVERVLILKSFTEQRTQRSFQPGESYSPEEIGWNYRRCAAYAARNRVELILSNEAGEEIRTAPLPTVADFIDAEAALQRGEPGAAEWMEELSQQNGFASYADFQAWWGEQVGWIDDALGRTEIEAIRARYKLAEEDPVWRGMLRGSKFDETPVVDLVREVRREIVEPPVIVPELNQSLPKRGKNQSKANEKQERKARVTRLRREGRTIEDIAEAENVSVATIKRDLGLKK